MYLQTSCHPAKLQPRMIAKCSLAGRPRRWLPGWCWSPDWHHLSHGGQETGRAATGRQVTLRGLPHREGQAEPSPHSQGAWPFSFPAGRPEAELGLGEIFRPPLRLLLPPSLQLSSPAFSVGRRRTRKRSRFRLSPTSLTRHPLHQEHFRFRRLLYDRTISSTSLLPQFPQL